MVWTIIKIVIVTTPQSCDLLGYPLRLFANKTALNIMKCPLFQFYKSNESLIFYTHFKLVELQYVGTLIQEWLHYNVWAILRVQSNKHNESFNSTQITTTICYVLL